jgi:hypothetical protein
MINVRRIAVKRFEIEPMIAGATLPSRQMDESELPKSIVVALVALRMNGVGARLDGTGVMVAEGTWELDDSCLDLSTHHDDDA